MDLSENPVLCDVVENYIEELGEDKSNFDIDELRVRIDTVMDITALRSKDEFMSNDKLISDDDLMSVVKLFLIPNLREELESALSEANERGIVEVDIRMVTVEPTENVNHNKYEPTEYHQKTHSAHERGEKINDVCVIEQEHNVKKVIDSVCVASKKDVEDNLLNIKQTIKKDIDDRGVSLLNSRKLLIMPLYSNDLAVQIYKTEENDIEHEKANYYCSCNTENPTQLRVGFTRLVDCRKDDWDEIISDIIRDIRKMLPLTLEPVKPKYDEENEESMSKNEKDILSTIMNACGGKNPGPQPIGLRRKHLDSILEKGEFKIGEKTNGMRALLYQYFDTHDGFNGTYKRRLKPRGSRHTVGRVDLDRNHTLDNLGECVLDGELVWNMTHGCMVYMVFDAYGINGECIMKEPFVERQEKLKNRYDWVRSKIQKTENDDSLTQMPVVLKEWHDPANLYGKVGQFIEDGIFNRYIGTQDDGDFWYHHKTDGYIAQPANKGVNRGAVIYKFKTPEDTTIDYKITEEGLEDDGSYFIVSGGNYGEIIESNVCWNEADMVRIRRRYPSGHKEFVCEFMYQGCWIPIFPRTEKTTPNKTDTVISSLDSLKDHLTDDEFMRKMQQI